MRIKTNFFFNWLLKLQMLQVKMFLIAKADDSVETNTLNKHVEIQYHDFYKMYFGDFS